MEKEYELYVWQGDYGVASVDINSLIIITYIKFSKISCLVNYSTNPLNQSLPTLYIKTSESIHKITGFIDIWIYLQNYISDIDNLLPLAAKWEPFVYFEYIKNSLLPGLQFTMWVDDQNYIKVTRTWFRSSMPLPLNFLYPCYKKNQITNFSKILTPEENLDAYSSLLLKEAKECINDLSTKLGNKTYFYGEHPTSLDAIIYGFLAPLLNVPIPSADLQLFLKEQTNLVAFIKRITTSLFPQNKLEYKYVKELQAENDVQEFQTSPRTVAFAAFCVASLMVSYGMVNGIFKISTGL